MTENVLRQLPLETLLSMAVDVIDDFMKLQGKTDTVGMEQKKQELFQLNNIIKERQAVRESIGVTMQKS